MSHQFSLVPQAEIPRSSFNRSHGYKTTFDAGFLVPMFVDEALPGDTFNLRTTGFARLATPLHPFMDNLFMNTFFFAVPKRLLWDNWQKFNGEQENPGDSTDYLVPTMPAPASTGYTNGSLHDYLGLPTEVADYSHTALYHRAYNLIWGEWFRDQNLQNNVPQNRGDGPDDPADYVLLKRGKRHDYFTAALPWPQKGDSVELPLGGTAPVISAGDGIPLFELDTTGYSLQHTNATGASAEWDTDPAGIGPDVAKWDETKLETDLSAATAATINQLRQAFQVQKMFERDARSGTRYTEVIKAHFGVTSPDARLQRPEYLGGGQTPINVQPIPQTTQTSETIGGTVQGNLAGVGTAVFNGHGFTKSFTEHCVLIGLVCVRADLNYQQGLNRMFSRSTRFDYYWPALSHIGEQAVLNKEIMMQNDPADELVFGYQERYAEYRYKPSQVTGQFRSNFAQTLDTWHLAQDFATLPSLSGQFIEENPPVDRVIAVQDEPHFLYDSYINLICARPMPIYGVPGLIDHF